MIECQSFANTKCSLYILRSYDRLLGTAILGLESYVEEDGDGCVESQYKFALVDAGDY